ncbi:MAG: diaminopropionate ammonia-lyase [Siculibacillus sp.]|nr:diaminopropionate ammonia-lyase [Siculibacillus sp.]
MFLPNRHPDHAAPLDPVDAETLGAAGAARIEDFLAGFADHRPTPLVALPGLAAATGVAAIHLKNEGARLGLGSFKALGGAYAVALLVLEEAQRHLDRVLSFADLADPAVRAVAAGTTFACATDGNHGRSVAWGAARVGARSVIFVHRGVSDPRVAAIARFGAEMVRVDGSYDESVEEAARVAAREGWTVVSDTSWDGYERIPGLVMQGYTAIVAEALRQLPAPPTHVFVQCGVGGIAAATAAHFVLRLGDARPRFVVVDPARAACMFESARAGRPVKVAEGEPTVMAMLDCYDPSPLAWRVLARLADGFMTVDEEEAVAVMRRLADPLAADPPVVAGESGGVGLAGYLQVVADPAVRDALGLDATSRIFVVVTEGATDPALYERLVGRPPSSVGTSGAAP